MHQNNQGGFGNTVWLRDKDGKEYACSADAFKGELKNKKELSEAEKCNCIDVSTIVGTERW